LIKDKAPEKKQEKPSQYELTAKQKELLGRHGQPAIVRQLSNNDLVVKLKGEDWIFGYDGLNMSKKEYDQKYGAKSVPSTPTYISYGKTICQEKPETCKPRPIEHVAWDADHTIWNLSHGIASSVTGPLKKIDDNTVIELGTSYKPKMSKKKSSDIKDLHLSKAMEFAVDKQQYEHGAALSGQHTKQGTEITYFDGTTIVFSGAGNILSSRKTAKPPEPKGYEYKDFWSELAEENEEWWKQPEEEGELEEIEESLLEGLTEKDKEFLSSLEGVTGKEQELLALPPGKTPTPEVTKEEPHEVNRITLLPTFLETLNKLEKSGIKSSVISLNTKGTVSRILEAFGLKDRFVEIRDSWENKGKVFKDISHAHKLCPCESIFVDDTKTNVRDVSDACALGLVIGKDGDVEKPIDIFRFIKEA
jgi:phosphoglycolate phosphatase-like HAD superfamily hydrolase